MASDNPDRHDMARDAAMDGPGVDHSKLPRTAMLFSASAWTFNVRLGRSGREEGEGVIIMGEVSYRSSGGERCVHPARIMIVKSDARKRLDIVLQPQETVITIPLEPFAMQRLQDRLKDLVSRHGMTLRVAFTASETSERQGLEAVDIAFSSGTRPPSQAPRPS
ncbi:MAG TPA: hypothetical protein VGA77_08215 [Propylenella sp.]